MPTNAADLYREAFARLPDGDYEDYAARLREDDPENAAWLDSGCESLDLLHRAAGSDQIDWGPEAILQDTLDDLSGARRLATLAMIRARSASRRADFAAWIADIVAVITLGRHLGKGKYLSGLAGFPLEDLAVREADEVLDDLDAETCRALVDRLDSLPPQPSLADAVRAEAAEFREKYLDLFAGLDDDADVSPAVRRAFGLPARTEENAEFLEGLYPFGDPADRMLLASDETRSGLIALAEQTLDGFEELAEIAEDSVETAPYRLSSLRVISESNPLLADVLDSFELMCPLWARFDDFAADFRARVASRGAAQS